MRAFFHLVGAFDHIAPGGLIDKLSVRELLLDDVHFIGVLQARRPLARANADDAANDLGHALQQHDRAGQRNDELERVQRQRRGVERLLMHRQRFAEVSPAGPGQRADAGQEEQSVRHQVEPGLRARLEAAVEEVASHMAVVRQGVGAAHHEQRAVHHVVDVVDPCRRRVQRIALEDLGADHQHQGDDQPSEGLADEGAEPVDGVEEALGVHWQGAGRAGMNSNSRPHARLAKARQRDGGPSS